MRQRLSELQRRSKIFIAMSLDFFWLFFLVCFWASRNNLIAENFSRNIVDIALENILNFIIPISLSLVFSFLLGFYSQVIRFYDSSNRLWVPVLSCLILALHGHIFIYQKFEYLVPGFLT